MKSPAMLTFTVVSSTSAAACPASAPRPSIARMRWRSVTAAGLRALNGRDLTRSPARTDIVSIT